MRNVRGRAMLGDVTVLQDDVLSVQAPISPHPKTPLKSSSMYRHKSQGLTSQRNAAQKVSVIQIHMIL